MTDDKVTYEVTGLYAHSTRRFPAIKTANKIHAFGINLWRGSVWQRNPDGTRTLLHRVYN